MQSIVDIVEEFNGALTIEGAKKYSIAQTVNRGKDKLPALIDREGKAEYIGIDDRNAISWYHKANSMRSRLVASQGYGRSAGSQVNTYEMSMIVFVNRKLFSKYPDEVVQLIQVLTPETINKSIRISFNTTILNDQQVYSQEYLSDTYRLGPEHNLLQINYTLEATLKKKCLNTCSD